MVTRYISPPNTIILAVSPANADLATSYSLQLAKKVDPEGVRTVGVLTKLDLMDRGTDASDILMGKVMHLSHGFVGVVNRSQHDINTSKSMQSARADERAFFQNHPAYSAIADTQGTEYLAQKLNYILLEHIKSVVPDLKLRVDKLMDSTKKQMEKLGMLEQKRMDPGATMLSLIKAFSDAVSHTIDGGSTDASKDLLGGARLDYIFHECFATYVHGLNVKNLTDEYIRINARNMAGMHASLFPSDHVFTALAKQQIERLEEPSMKCVQFIYEELIKIVDNCAVKIDRFPKLKQAVVDLCRSLLNEYRTPTISHVRTIIAAERGFVNVKHPMMEKLIQRSFLKVFGRDTEKSSGAEKDEKEKKSEKGKKSVEQPADREANTNMGAVPTNILLNDDMSRHEQYINDAIREMVEGYFGIVKGNIADQVPKAITLLMIAKLREGVYAELVRKLYTDSVVKDMLAEPPHVEEQRNAATSMMKALVQAQNALDKVSEFTLVKHS
ncbi:Dynamin family Dynamin central region Dynamin GTPase effector domain [Trypanosoma vivax]|nr:Dynamin family Dynamin central region Dynamin GTPase effector domain [Trypanosoma vivax]